ncbi:YchJ family protein [Dechloromonas sp. ARDL1]|uniref:YchJ family protein n=1 Tax=Dechloromonas sp. ARDL1 TaxID=3322121 RepID=UPI003DA710B4
MKQPDVCPCGSGRRYAACCHPLHAGENPAASAEALMRSRYSAYVLKLGDYLLATWHASTRPSELDLDADSSKWLGLTVRSHQQLDEHHSTVEFVARYRIAGRGHRLHELSRFVREDGRWYYVDGEMLA